MVFWVRVVEGYSAAAGPCAALFRPNGIRQQVAEPPDGRCYPGVVQDPAHLCLPVVLILGTVYERGHEPLGLRAFIGLERAVDDNRGLGAGRDCCSVHPALLRLRTNDPDRLAPNIRDVLNQVINQLSFLGRRRPEFAERSIGGARHTDMRQAGVRTLRLPSRACCRSHTLRVCGLRLTRVYRGPGS
jgi:hypothetical protein